MKDIVIGSITNYNYDKIKYWVNSLEKSGFSGEKVMLCYNVSYDVCEELTRKGFTILGFRKNEEKKMLEYDKPNFNICLERFIHLWYFLNRLKEKEQYRYIVATDVRDVVFQSNPITWIENNIGDKKIIASSESIRYEHENWGKQNLFLSFGPLLYEKLSKNVIYNAGVLAGEFNTMLDLFLNVSLACSGSPPDVPGGGGPDQAGINVLYDLQVYKDMIKYAASEDGWAAQLGTTGPQMKHYKEYLVEPSPIMKDDLICTSTGKPFAIVHQYDRVPEFKDIIEKKYE